MEEVDAEEVVAAASSSSFSGSSVEGAVPKDAQQRMMGPAKRQSKGRWTEEEDEKLIKQVHFYGGRNWKKIAESFPGRTDVQCLHRWQKVLNPELIKGPWTKEEDDQIIELVAKHGSKKWSFIAKSLPGRIGKQCRERWHNHLNPAIKKDAWTDAEEVALIRAHQVYGNKWAEIARFLPGRADNSIKNHWNCSVKKKLCSCIASGLLGPIPCVAHNYHNALKGKCYCKHSGDSFLSCEQRGCLHGDASWLESLNQSASSSDIQHSSLTPPETHVSEFSEGTVKLEKVERDMYNGSGVMCCQCTTGQEDENLSDESGGSLILMPNETVLVADADLVCSPETLVSKPEEKASPSCLQSSHCSLSFSSAHLVEEKIPLKNSNFRSGIKKNVDIASSVPTRDSKIVEDPQPFTEKVMDELCDAIDSGAASDSSILHKNESCYTIPSGNFKDFYAPDQFRDLEFGRLCYNPINLTYRDAPFSKTLGSWNELEQNPVYPDPQTNTVNTYVRGSSPESILRNAARNFRNAPSILRKRRRETLRSFPSETIKTNSTRFGFNGVPEVRGGKYSMRRGCSDNLTVKQLSVSNHDHLQAQRLVSVNSVERWSQNETDMESENVDTKFPRTDTACNPIDMNLLWK